MDDAGEKTKSANARRIALHVAMRGGFAHDTAFGFGTTPRLSVLDCESRATLDPTSRNQGRNLHATTVSNCAAQRHAWRADRRHGRRGHDVYGRSRAGAPRESRAGGFADAAGDDSPGQAHRKPRADDSRFCAAGENRGHRVRRLGYFSGHRLRSREERGGAEPGTSGTGEGISLQDPADEGGVRSDVREIDRWTEREKGREQIRVGAAD